MCDPGGLPALEGPDDMLEGGNRLFQYPKQVRFANRIPYNKPLGTKGNHLHLSPGRDAGL